MQAHEETDAIIEDIKKKLRRHYARAYRSLRDRALKYLDKFAKQDEELAKKVRAGKISQKAYNEWRVRHIITGQIWTNEAHAMAIDLAKSDEFAIAYMSGRMPDVYALNYNYYMWKVETWAAYDTGFTLYNRDAVMLMMQNGEMPWLPAPSDSTLQRLALEKKVLWNRKQITSVMTQGIMQGLSIPKLARQLEAVTEKNYKAAVRNARTMATGVQNEARYAASVRAKKMGIGIKNMWRATLDMRTRHEHRVLDGETAEVGKPFKVDGYKIRFPGDPEAPAHLVYNCRCTLEALIDGLTPTAEKTRSTAKLAGMSYEEWKNEAKKRVAEKSKNSPDPNPEENKEKPEKHVTETSAPHPKTWKEIAEDVKKMSWDDIHKLFIPKDSYYYSSDYQQLLKEERDGVRQEKEYGEQIKALEAQLESERSLPPKSEWSELDALWYEITGAKPYVYTAKGEELQERIKGLRKAQREAGSKHSDAYEKIQDRDRSEYWKQEKEWRNSAHSTFVRGDINKEYEGFSTKMNSAYDADLLAGKGFIAEMSPDEYLQRISYDSFHTSIERTTVCYYENIKKYADMMADGTKFDMGFIDYSKEGQEGRHRAMAAKLLGIKKIPVYIRY